MNLCCLLTMNCNKNWGDLPLYEPLYVNDLAPPDRYQRRRWISGIKLSFPIMLYKYAYGNHIGTLIYAWKVPNDGPADSTTVSRIFCQLSGNQLFYSTRAMRQDFLDRYSRIAKISKCLLRNIYRNLLDDGSSASCSHETEVDERVAKAVMEIDDPSIVMDLRSLNGKPTSSKFDAFWQELATYLEEITPAVDDRRHGETLHMPLAVSIRDLHEQITQRLKQKHPEEVPVVPSLEWVRLQFWPANPYTDRAIRYTGRFQVKFGVQIRQLRKDHADRHYVSALLKYVRHFSVLMRPYLTYMSVDDKAIVPVGEPNAPVSTGVRGHNRSLVPVGGPQLSALDHDFHLHGIVPSVAFCVDIPDNTSDSFYKGQAFVINKDKVTQASSALRHSTELKNLITVHCGGTDSATKPILVVVSDGGPDHRVTFGSVKVASLALFHSLNLDMLVCVRTCPYQSWQNIAERIMSTLNLALQNVSLERSTMRPEYERAVLHKNTLSDIRAEIAKHPELDEAVKDSMVAPMALIGRRFQRMKIKEKQIIVGVPATTEEIEEQFQHVRQFDPSISRGDHSAKALGQAVSLQEFLKDHSHSSHYVFQVKKCTLSTCSYCTENPPRLPVDDFLKVSFFPLPLLDESKEHYKQFDSVYRQLPSEVDRPSRAAEPSTEAKQQDSENKALLVAGKVRGCIECSECGKCRCVYSPSVLHYGEEIELARIRESKLYTCGSVLFPPGHMYEGSIIVREALTCNSTIEAQYFSSKLVSFPLVCYHCGLTEETLVNDDEIEELKKSYAIVYPICFLCKTEGKKVICRKPSNVAKRRKLS